MLHHTPSVRAPIALRHCPAPQIWGLHLQSPRVIHLTDWHVGRVASWPLLAHAMDLARAQQPDLCVLTGDFVSHSLHWLDMLDALVRRLAVPTVAVLGNHDHWCGAAAVRHALERAGAIVLQNAWTEVRMGSGILQIAGVDDAVTGHANPSAATRGIRPDRPTLGLSHVAEQAEALWSAGVSLVLSGHTHGGQIAAGPLHRWMLRRAGHRYIHGLYRRSTAAADHTVYVSAGLGAAVLPLRVGRSARREIVRIGPASDPLHIPTHIPVAPGASAPVGPSAVPPLIQRV